MQKFQILSMKCALILLSLAVVTYAGVPFNDCGSDFEINEVIIKACDDYEDVQSCYIQKGSNTTVIINFASSIRLDSMQSEASVTMYGQKFNIPVDPKSVCEHWKCPVTYSDNIVSHNSTITMSSLIPGSATLMMNSTYQLSDKVRIAFCFKTAIKMFDIID